MFSDLSSASELDSAEEWGKLTAEDIEKVTEAYTKSSSDLEEIKFRSQMCELLKLLLSKILLKKDFAKKDLSFEENIKISDSEYISHMNFNIAISKEAKPHLLLLYAFKSNKTSYRIPIVIGELKKETLLSDKTQFVSACKQLLSYQVAVQRSLRQSSGTSGTAEQTLFGFVMDQREAYIIELNADLWNTDPILNVKSIERFRVSLDDKTYEQSIQFFKILLVRVLNAMPSNNAVGQLTEPLFHFPSSLGAVLFDNPCILKAKSNKLQRFFEDDIENIDLCYPEEVLDIDWDEPDTVFVLKV